MNYKDGNPVLPTLYHTVKECDEICEGYNLTIRSMNDGELQEEIKKLNERNVVLNKKDPIFKKELKEKEEIFYKLSMIQEELEIRKLKGV